MKRSSKREGNGRRIAVVEETAENIYSVKFVLQSLGYEVISLAWDELHPEVLADFRPDLVLVDMMIPGGAAYRVLRALHEELGAKVPIVALTAEAMEGSEDEVLQAGGRDTLDKPYSVEELQQKLNQWLPPS